ncbi:hypothetical protein EHQ68_08335 [Leptospira congkakensis]|uniref:Uncharacterized protein n=1 Tax=Leptospira congkakensis TaxID=2484932 RepID=A0A4Z1AJA6_9LEPT|nr:hypothetical protein [Leptospira congkakensis]TGL88638.1 hypothetical protein EHQ69_14405 [Leptospira congkakensis]TGL89224.1 hypothetical protein EHQ68_08335 [Leptospira congkakensis]TGL97192.1 hypothetical protein EHQ70_07830 [Leptospira congkakensis]
MILFNHIWIVFIIVTVFNALVLKFRSQKYIKAKPELEPGYDKLVKGIIFYGNIPWVIVGIGNLSQYTTGLFDYLYLNTFNPFIIIFYISILVIWLLAFYWIYFKQGAEFLIEHPGLIRVRDGGISGEITAKKIKIFVGLILFSNMIMVLFLLYQINIAKLIR